MGVASRAEAGAAKEASRGRVGAPAKSDSEARLVPAVERLRNEETPAQVIVVDGATHWRRWWADLYVYRGALYSLAWRNVRSRYKQAALGVLWAVIQPAVQVLVFTLLFGKMAKIPSGGVPYAVFVLAGLLPWNLFSKVVSDGAVSLVTNQNIMSKLFFPRLFLVLAAGGSALIDAAVTLVLLLLMIVMQGVGLGAGAMLALPALAGVLVLAYGFAALLAAVNARWRDVQHTLPLILQLGMFATPVVYQSGFLPSKWRWFLAFNPLTGYVELFRSAMLGLPLPEARLLFVSGGVSVIIVVGGLWLFRHSELTLVDVV